MGRMTPEQLREIIKSMTKNSKALTTYKGQRLMSLIKEYEHTIVVELQIIGELKRTVQTEVMKNGGPRLDL